MYESMVFWAEVIVYLTAMFALDIRGIVMITDAGLLFIEPQNPPSRQPVVDELTVKIVAARRQAKVGIFLNDKFFPDMSSKGKHFCSCGAVSSSQDYLLPGGEVTNSLAGHYLAWHRGEVSQSQLERVGKLAVSGVEPTADELVTPHGGR